MGSTIGDTGAIKYYIRNGARHYRRKDFIEWAVSKEFPLCEEMLIFAGRLKPKPEIESDADRQPEPASVEEEDLNTYERRKVSFELWLANSGVNIVDLTDKDTIKILKQHNKGLWNLTLSSYRSEFWNHYKNKNGIKKKQGRRAKK